MIGIALASLVVIPALALAPALAPARGETPPKGPPWHIEYRHAKAEALRFGRPVFVYFTKTV